MRSVFFLLILSLTSNLSLANASNLTLRKIGVRPAKITNDLTTPIPDPMKKNPLLATLMEENTNTEPMMIRPRIDYEEFLRMKAIPKVLGLNLLMNY